MLIGLTGGICSGKTTIARAFGDMGASIIDLDSLGHQVLKDDGLVKERLVYSFGAGILDPKGDIDRGKLGRLVFVNPDYLITLNSIVHPPLIKLADERIQSELSQHKIVVLDAALLIECNMTHMVDFVVLTYTDENTQVKRLIKRGFSEEDAWARVRSQISFKEKKLYADYIIDNSTSVSDAVKQAKEIWKQLQNHSKSHISS